jgi:MerR family transcriptional regulator, heat shock protein HspR
MDMPRSTQPSQDGHLLGEDDPCYVISIAARLVGLHQQTLRYYERVGLITPNRTRGNIRMYSNADIQRIRQAQRLIGELGVNLAGVEVIMRMNDQIQNLQSELKDVRDELNRLRGNRLPAPYTPRDRRPS